MKILKWTNREDTHAYMRGMRDINMERSVKNVNENWMYSKLSEEWRRQSLWGYRIFDFWNHKIGCAVEVDVEEHDRDYDNYRDEYNYRRSGIVVLRVRNRNEADADEVLSTISRLGDHRERKTAMGIMGNRKQKSSLAEKPYDKNNLMFLGFMKSIGHTPYWDTSPLEIRFSCCHTGEVEVGYVPGTQEDRTKERSMSKNTYEYTFTTDDSDDRTVSIKVVSFTSTKGSFSLQAPDPDDYYGSSEIEWECAEDLSEISKEQIDSMEEWLFNEHSEYLQDLSYYD